MPLFGSSHGASAGHLRYRYRPLPYHPCVVLVRCFWALRTSIAFLDARQYCGVPNHRRAGVPVVDVPVMGSVHMGR